MERRQDRSNSLLYSSALRSLPGASAIMLSAETPKPTAPVAEPVGPKIAEGGGPAVACLRPTRLVIGGRQRAGGREAAGNADLLKVVIDDLGRDTL